MLSEATSLLVVVAFILLTNLQENLSQNVTASRRKTLLPYKTKQLGSVCVANSDCLSNCCIYGRTIYYGNCVFAASLGQICGFAVTGEYSATGIQYHICNECPSNCCCGTGCCPTTYCLVLLDLVPKACTTCLSGCCCTNDTCCPISYCQQLSAGTSLQSPSVVQGSPCLRCNSGCCCDDACCLAQFCKGTLVGTWCQTCVSGCCCGDLCCASSFCDAASISAYQQQQHRQMSFGSAVTGPSNNALLQFANMRLGKLCLTCSTGCCCLFGCCNLRYCNFDG